MSSSTVSDEDPGANALSIDAGSLASLMSSIAVIEELMRRVQEILGLPNLPNPCDHYDLMVGAGFAGLLVIMLGRLRMSLDEAKFHCSTIVKDVFSEKKRFGERFKASNLEAAVKRMLESCGAGADARMMDNRVAEGRGCRVMVCVAPELASAGVCLRTYAVGRNSVPDCTIVEAIRATFALPGLFKPAVFTESGGIKVSYIGLDGVNPTAQLLDEVAHVLPSRHMSSITSIGAGQKRTKAVDGERTAQEMAARFVNTPGFYFRLSVERGMQEIELADWEKLSGGIVHARTYLALPENDMLINELAQALGKKSKIIPTAHLKAALPASSAKNHELKGCPPPSRLFVGRVSELKGMKRCLSNGSEERHVCVLHGLGGAGKTQLALKFVELYKNEYQHIFYVNSTSAQTIEADLKNIALAKIASDKFSDALSWLARTRENWLIVYNNADDTSLKIRSYFPACSHGNILITTRNRRMINLAEGVGAKYHVLEMSEDDAGCLLAKAAGIAGETGPSGLALIKKLGCFALAIVQAGAYIHTNCCTIAEYLDMYNTNRGQLLEEYAELLEKADDYELTAYATWRVSYAKLKPLAKQLYELLAFMHHDHISEDIFQYATIGIKEDKWKIPPIDEESATQETITTMLANFTRTTDGSWDKAAFIRTINELQSYSLLAYDGVNRTYSIHPLVHEWTRTMVNDSPATGSCTSFLLASSVIWEFRAEDMAFRRMLLNHIDFIPTHEKMKPRLAARFAVVYEEAGRQQDTERLIKVAMEAMIKLYGREHESIVKGMAYLALTYWSQGRWQEAEVLEREVLDIRKRVLGNEHPDTLMSMGNLAVAYSSQGRWQEAEVLEREVLDLSKRVLGNEHPHTLMSMSNLASTYSGQGRWQEAEVLEREVLDLRKRVLGNEHPDTLTSMANLANTYSDRGRWQEAEVLEREVLDIRKRVLGNEHPYTLTSMANLASTYSSQGRWQEAEVLQWEVLELKKRVLGSEHPETLIAMHWVAVTCYSLGRACEAETLMIATVDASKRVLGDAHPDTVARLKYLAQVQLEVKTKATTSS